MALRASRARLRGRVGLASTAPPVMALLLFHLLAARAIEVFVATERELLGALSVQLVNRIVVTRSLTFSADVWDNYPRPLSIDRTLTIVGSSLDIVLDMAWLKRRLLLARSLDPANPIWLRFANITLTRVLAPGALTMAGLDILEASPGSFQHYADLLLIADACVPMPLFASEVRSLERPAIITNADGSLTQDASMWPSGYCLPNAGATNASARCWPEAGWLKDLGLVSLAFSRTGARVSSGVAFYRNCTFVCNTVLPLACFVNGFDPACVQAALTSWGLENAERIDQGEQLPGVSPSPAPSPAPLLPPPLPSPPLVAAPTPSSEGAPLGVILPAAIAGGVGLLLMVAAVVFWATWRRRRASGSTGEGDGGGVGKPLAAARAGSTASVMLCGTDAECGDGMPHDPSHRGSAPLLALSSSLHLADESSRSSPGAQEQDAGSGVNSAICRAGVDGSAGQPPVVAMANRTPGGPCVPLSGSARLEPLVLAGPPCNEQGRAALLRLAGAGAADAAAARRSSAEPGVLVSLDSGPPLSGAPNSATAGSRRAQPSGTVSVFTTAGSAGSAAQRDTHDGILPVGVTPAPMHRISSLRSMQSFAVARTPSKDGTLGPGTGGSTVPTSLHGGWPASMASVRSGGLSAQPMQSGAVDAVITTTTPVNQACNLSMRLGLDVFLIEGAVRGTGAYGTVMEGVLSAEAAEAANACSESGALVGAGAERRVAVKLLRGLSGTASSKEVTALQREVAVLSRCRHANIVRLLGAGLSPPEPFLVEELMHISLDRLIHDDAVELPLEQVLRIGRDVALGLAYLHPTCTHRDLKPSNVLLDNQGTAKLSDFGIARLAIATGTQHTACPEVGSVPYQANECFGTGAHEVSHRCDLYSLGVTLWEALSRQRPWAGQHPMKVAIAVSMRGERLPMDAIPPERAHKRLLRLVEECWSEDPYRRPSALDVAKRLSAMLQHLTAGADASGGNSTPPAFPSGGGHDDPQQPQPRVLQGDKGGDVAKASHAMHRLKLVSLQRHQHEWSRPPLHPYSAAAGATCSSAASGTLSPAVRTGGSTAGSVAAGEPALAASTCSPGNREGGEHHSSAHGGGSVVSGRSGDSGEHLPPGQAGAGA